MKRDERITKSHQYAAVYKKGSSWPSRLLVLRILPNEYSKSRFGISVSKKVGNAVVRNKIKRRLKEIFRFTPVEPGWDIVCIVRPAAAKTGYLELKQSLEALLDKANVLERKNNGNSSE